VIRDEELKRVSKHADVFILTRCSLRAAATRSNSAASQRTAASMACLVGMCVNKGVRRWTEIKALSELEKGGNPAQCAHMSTAEMPLLKQLRLKCSLQPLS
jgi:hypothetical protein